MEITFFFFTCTESGDSRSSSDDAGWDCGEANDDFVKRPPPEVDDDVDIGIL